MCYHLLKCHQQRKLFFLSSSSSSVFQSYCSRMLFCFVFCFCVLYFWSLFSELLICVVGWNTKIQWNVTCEIEEKIQEKNFSNQFFYTLNNQIRIARKYGIKLVWNFILFFLLRYIEMPSKAFSCICTRFMLEINESQPTKKISMKQENKKAKKLLFRSSANKWNKKAGRNLSKNWRILWWRSFYHLTSIGFKWAARENRML